MRAFLLAVLAAPAVAYLDLPPREGPRVPGSARGSEEHEQRRTIVAALYAFLLFLPIFLFGYAKRLAASLAGLRDRQAVLALIFFGRGGGRPAALEAPASAPRRTRGPGAGSFRPAREDDGARRNPEAREKSVGAAGSCHRVAPRRTVACASSSSARPTSRCPSLEALAPAPASTCRSSSRSPTGPSDATPRRGPRPWPRLAQDAGPDGRETRAIAGQRGARRAHSRARPDVVVVVAYGRILPTELLELPRLGSVNVHASLLPRHRGASPVQAAILAGDRETGVVTMRVVEELDAGPLYLEERHAIGEREDAGALSAARGPGRRTPRRDPERARSRNAHRQAAGGRAHLLPPDSPRGRRGRLDPAGRRIERARSRVHAVAGAVHLSRARTGQDPRSSVGPSAAARPRGNVARRREGEGGTGEGGSVIVESAQRAGRKPVSGEQLRRGIPPRARFGTTRARPGDSDAAPRPGRGRSRCCARCSSEAVAQPPCSRARGDDPLPPTTICCGSSCSGSSATAALDAELASASRVALARLTPGLREILEVALYQLRHLDRIPAYAAVDEAVAQARRRGREGAARLVNAVLRELLRRPPAPPVDERRRTARGALDAVLSSARFLVERWLARFGAETTRCILEADNASSGST